MQSTSPEYRHLARSILAREGGNDSDVGALRRATERVFGQLFNQLVRLIGVTGSLTLFTRAVYLVRNEFPFLEPVQLATTAEACRVALGEALKTVAPEQAHPGVTALLASYLASLASFVGDDLVLILVREIWPDHPAIYDKPGCGGSSDD